MSEQAHSLMQHYERRDEKMLLRWRKPSQKVIRESVITRRKDSNGQTHTVFHCGGDATISLAGSTVTWDVPENNHAPERAHGHPLAAALFAHLRAVRWTSRSGGTITGNDEYSRDNRDSGGGGNYTVETFSSKTAAGTRSRYPLLQPVTRQPCHWAADAAATSSITSGADTNTRCPTLIWVSRPSRSIARTRPLPHCSFSAASSIVNTVVAVSVGATGPAGVATRSGRVTPRAIAADRGVGATGVLIADVASPRDAGRSPRIGRTLGTRAFAA